MVSVKFIFVWTMNTFETKYGKVTLYKNEKYIGWFFQHGQYWDEDILVKLRKYIPPDRNILEIGGHCGTSSLVYASFLNPGQQVHVYEPQKNMYDLLVKNIVDNHLSHKIVPHHLGVFCFSGNGTMNAVDIDGGGGVVQKRYTDESNLPCNFGGIGLGQGGESIEMTTVDAMGLDNIGFIHCDAQGAENYIFSQATQTLARDRPVIIFEDNAESDQKFFDTVCQMYPEYTEASRFNVRKYCLDVLGYSTAIDKFNGSNDCLLLP